MISEIFVKRPVMTVLVMSAITIFGVISYKLLPVSALPNVDFPTIQVSASLPGANAETMASSVATPLEKQFSAIAGIESMNSTSTLGSTQITLQFALNRNIDAAGQDVQAAISLAQPYLPKTMLIPPSYKKVNPADYPVFYLALDSDTIPISKVNEYAETTMAQRISMISGVAQVVVYGQQKYAVRVKVDPNKLAYRKIGIDEIRQALIQSNVNTPLGSFYGSNRATTLQTNGQLQDAASYRTLIVTYRNGSPVRLGELGEVVDGVEKDRTAAWYNGKRGIVLAIQKQPGTNTIEVVDAIKKIMPTFREQVPAGVNISILYDRSQSIRESVRDVEFSLILALALVVMVIFLFLRNLSATIIPSIALPISIIGTFSVMYLLGYSLDNLSLMALTLCVGFIVDDAIVMLENITRHMELGKNPMEATLQGSKEISFTIISMTISLVAVFIPIVFMGGILGKLLYEFAITIIVSVLISGFVSLSLTPMLCSRFLKHQHNKHGKTYTAIENVFENIKNKYETSLRWVIVHKRSTMLTLLGIVIAISVLFAIIPKGFLPNDDIGQVFCFTEAAQDISYEGMVRQQQQIAEVIKNDPNVESMMSFVGRSGQMNSGIVFAKLKPRSERVSASEVVQELRAKVSNFPGIKAYPQVPPTIRIGGQLTKSMYQYTLQDTDTTELFTWVPILEKAIKEIPGFFNVTTDLQITQPQVFVQVDRDKATALSVTLEQIENGLYDAYGEHQISTIYTSTNQYAVILELQGKFISDPSALSLLYIKSSNGNLVPLNTFAHLKPTVGPLSINHSGQLPSVTISFDLEPGLSLGEAIKRIKKVTENINMPSTISSSFQGAAQAFQSSLAGMGILMFMAVFVIYIILGILYESFIHPLTIISGIPTAGLGAIITLMIFQKDLDMYGFVGMIMLIGIVKKNAIMMIDFALEAQRKDNQTPAAAIFDACIVRFRPIMMTTMAALFGAIPIALGLGAGGESRQTLGLTVVGGLLVSQILTLYITPVVFLYLDSFEQWIKRRKQPHNS